MAELNTDLLIIGGGVTGLCTAYLCRKKNIDCTLIESQETLGKKWRLAGGAMGNMTNRTISPEHYVSHNSKQAKKLLQTLFKSWTTEHVLAFMHEMDMEYEERDFGQIFCKEPVKNLIGTLVQSLAKTRILTNEKIQSFSCEQKDPKKHYIIQTKTHTIRCGKLVIATGSSAYPQLGASDFALQVARKWGHKTFPFRSALAPLLLPEHSPLLGLEGISLPVRMKSFRDGQEKADPCGIRPLLFTHTGLRDRKSVG